MNTACLLSIPANMFPDREILVFEKSRLTYGQLWERVRRLSSGLRSLGLGRGNRIGLLQTTSNQHVEAYYATSRLGATFVPLNCRAESKELRYLIGTAQVDTLLLGQRFVDVALSLRSDLPSVRHWIALERKREGMLFLEDLLSGPLEEDTEEDMEGGDANIVVFTSGTTSLPKGVMLSHRSLLDHIFSTVELAGGGHWGATLLCVPLHHIAGVMVMLASIYEGRRLVLMPHFDAKKWLRLVEDEKITHAFLVPAMLKKLVDEPELARSDLSSLQILSYGAAPTPLPILHRAISSLPKNVSFVNTYGQTETTSAVTMLLPEDHRLEGSPEEVDKKLRRLSSVGRPLPNVEVKIVDDEGNELSPGEIGEITVRTPTPMKGYVGQNGLSREIHADGWISTRDLGWVDEDGYVFLAGRKDHLVIAGEGNVEPTEIESALLYAGISTRLEERAQRRLRGMKLVSREKLANSIRAEDMSLFLESIYENLEVGTLRENYLATIPNLVSASAYGFLLLESQPSWRRKTSVQDSRGQIRDQDQETWLAHEPVAVNAIWRWQPSDQSQLPWGGEWHHETTQDQASLQLMPMQRLCRFVRVPIGTADGELFGALSFARTSDCPSFDKTDLATIRVVARHVCLALRQALKHAEVCERSASAEAALQAMGAAVVLSDEQGTIKFTNVRAQKLLERVSIDLPYQSLILNGLHDNLMELEDSGKRVATRAISLPTQIFSGQGCLVLRSVRTCSPERRVATFLYTLEQTPDFHHLSSLLSDREMEVLELLARGFQNKEIAEALVVTPNTVKYHLKQIFSKMQVSSRSELLAKAFSSSQES